ncbi:MAG TPA: hypothetical protein VGG10_06835 [Rhizomicrobium sp.]|jgi:hypothetical protein
MQETEAVRRRKLARLRAALAKGEADIAAGRYTVLTNDEEIDGFFANLNSKLPPSE